MPKKWRVMVVVKLESKAEAEIIKRDLDNTLENLFDQYEIDEEITACIEEIEED